MVGIIKDITCTFILERCNFANAQLAPACVRKFCAGQPYGFGSCTALYPGAPTNCCSQSDPATCLASFQASQGFNATRSGDECLLLEAAVNNCLKIDPIFGRRGYKAQAGCLCYDAAGNYSPEPWDDAAASCVATAAKTHPTIFALLGENHSAGVSLCTKFAGPITSTATGSNSAAATASATDSAGLTVTASVVDSSSGTVVPSTTQSSSTAKATSNVGSRNGQMSFVDMKWMIAGLGFMLPGLVIGAL